MRRGSAYTHDEIADVPFNHLIEQSDLSLSSYISGDTGAEGWHDAKAVVRKENKKHHFGKISWKWARAMTSNDLKEI